MGIDPLYHSGLLGIQRGLENMRKSAHEIARTGTVEREKGIVNVADELVALKINRTAVEAAVRVVQSADEVLGSLIDLHA